MFDDAELWDSHRTAGAQRSGTVCADPRALGLVQTRNGIWLRTLDQAG